MTTIYKSLRTAPTSIPRAKILYLAHKPPMNVCGALSVIIPDFGAAFERIAGFKIPIHRKLLSILLTKAIAQGRTDTATIISAIFESVKIAKSGSLKTLSLEIILKVLLLIAKSGELPGIKKYIPISEYRCCYFLQIISG